MLQSKKVVLLGHFGVGKTSLIRRFVQNEFSENYKVTIGVHISKKVVKVAQADEVSLIIWDLEGTDDPESIRRAYLLGTHGMIYVFDISRPSSFQNIERDLAVVRELVKDVPLVVVGNKLDLVKEEQARTILEQHKIRTDFLSSAKSGDGVEKVFEKLASLVSTHD